MKSVLRRWRWRDILTWVRPRKGLVVRNDAARHKRAIVVVDNGLARQRRRSKHLLVLRNISRKSTAIFAPDMWRICRKSH